MSTPATRSGSPEVTGHRAGRRDAPPSRHAVVDAHLHLWDIGTGDYPWLTPEAGSLYRNFDWRDADAELDASGVDSVVLVQAANSYADTDAMLAVAHQWRRAAGVVGWVPLDRPDEAAASLDRYAADPALVGVRHLIHEEEDGEWLLRPAVQQGLALLAERELPFDVVAVTTGHLAQAAVIAERFPSLRLVIDHLGKPPIEAGGPLHPWADLIDSLAEHSNVYAKLSGLETAGGLGYELEDIEPFVDHALQAFSPARLMWGSDWPVCTLVSPYARIRHNALYLLRNVDDAAVSRLLSGTAVDFYRLASRDAGVP